MKTTARRLLASGLGAMLLMLLYACAVTGVGIEGSAGYDGGYYEPYGYDYGDWGIGYLVGPSRCCEHGEHRDARHDEHPGDRDRERGGRAPAYRPAPAGRPAPSIPGRSRTH